MAEGLTLIGMERRNPWLAPATVQSVLFRLPGFATVKVLSTVPAQFCPGTISAVTFIALLALAVETSTFTWNPLFATSWTPLLK